MTAPQHPSSAQAVPPSHSSVPRRVRRALDDGRSRERPAARIVVVLEADSPRLIGRALAAACRAGLRMEMRAG